MCKQTKLVVRSLRKIRHNKFVEFTRRYSSRKVFPDFKIHDQLLLREALGEKTPRLYVKALRVATRKPLRYSDSMSVGDLIKTLCAP
ncbi:hypothetical protein [Pseudomonas alloputida]|uniref:hypothetical protein n=1 Tax=Pseudomonas TaxID=286 RepID=UPI003EEE0642